MKVKVSISMDEETLQKVEQKLPGSIFRNKSHLVEYAVKNLLKTQNEDIKEDGHEQA